MPDRRRDAGPETFAEGPVAAGSTLADGPVDPAHAYWLLCRGPRPDLSAFLAGQRTLPPAKVAAVLRVDQRERWIAGDRIPAETYLAAYPALAADVESALDLIYSEILLREELGESVATQDYLDRFPALASELGMQIAFHGAIGNQALPFPPDDPDDPDASARTFSDSAPGAIEPGREPVIAGYEVLGILGEGGMGRVYRAWQVDLRRMVALKIVRTSRGAEFGRLRVEAEAIARLTHEHIVRIYQIGEYDGRPFLALEFIEGGSLAKRLAGGALWQEADAAAFVETLARAVHHAHARGVIHRDLTPANVLFTEAGVPKITDFGLAKLTVGAGSDRTLVGDILGTPSYMAPEQAAGRSRDIGRRTDVYALGAILYEVLCGRPPFRGESAMETIRQVQADEVVAPSSLRPRLSRELETICLTCLQKSPADRYPTAEALADDLRRYQVGRPIRAPRAPAHARAWRRLRRDPALAALGAALVSSTLVGLIGIAVVGRTVADLRRDAEALRREVAAQGLAVRRLEASLPGESRAAAVGAVGVGVGPDLVAGHDPAGVRSDTGSSARRGP